MQAIFWLIAAVGLGTTSATDAQGGAVCALVERFETARAHYDPAALERTLAPDYEEISPVGDVDSRVQVLGFYKPEAQRPTPPMTDSEVDVHVQGPIALVTLRTSLTLPNGTTRSLRVRYVARQSQGTWKLISAQYTPIPPAKPQ